MSRLHLPRRFERKDAPDAGMLPLQFELKDLDDKTGTFKGYASVFGALDLGLDIVDAGAFKRTLAEHSKKGTMPKMLWQHDRSQPIGVWKSMEEDARGLKVEGKFVLEVQRAREVHALMKAGAVDGLSIGYRTKKFKMDAETGIRHLEDVDLLEVSPVTFPMLPKALVQTVKGELPKTVREFEDYLRDAGFSAAAAKGIAASGFKAGVNARDEQPSAEDMKKAIALIERASQAFKPQP